MTRISTRPLTTDSWPVVETLFGANGACGGCWCMWWRVARGGKLWQETQGAKAKRSLKQLVTSGRAHAVLAFEGEEPVGWCGFGPRSDFPRLDRVRAYQRSDATQVWSINCFFIPARHRRKGVARLLLAAAIDACRAAGARTLEAYPVTTTQDGRAVAAVFAFTGPMKLFEEQGFAIVQAQPASKPLVRLELAPPLKAVVPVRKRKGATRMAAIPPQVLRALNAGREQTITLVEWLAIDIRKLIVAVAAEVQLAHRLEELRNVAQSLKKEGVSRRSRGMGAALHELITGDPRREAIFAALAAHRADMVRAWAAYTVAADASLPLDRRLAVVRRFAADPHMAVRECAWESLRPYLAQDLERGLGLLVSWACDADASVRRCAIEATRPRGVWCAHIDRLKNEPELGLPLLELVRSDASDYVRRSVANWLNDASKSQPDWVQNLGRRWQRESPTPETQWIIHRAQRTLRKREA